MGPDAQDEPLYDLGILFVHGIGQSARAETLLHFGEPLRKCIEDIAAPAPMSQNASVGVSIAAARLDPDAGQGPARAELRITNAAAAEHRWLLAEAWWAKKFPTPTVGEIVAWSFKVLPWTLIAHFDRRFRRMGFQFSKAIDGVHPLKRGLPYLVRYPLEGIKTFIALALLPLLLAILSVLTLLGMVPYAPVRDFARTVQRQLVATIGDSFALMDQPIIAAAITDSVRENLEWLAARCKRIAVVAHSQGGAIAHRVLRGPVTAPCDFFVTFGSGLEKLSEIEHVKDRQGRSWLSLATVGAFIAAACLFVNSVVLWSNSSVWAMFGWLARASVIVEIGMVLAIIDLLHASDDAAPDKPLVDTPPSWRFGLGFVLLAGGLVAGIEWRLSAWPQVLVATAFAAGLAMTYLSMRHWQVASGRSLNARTQWLQDRNLYRQRFQLHNRPHIPWFDFYASADPVPNGPLLDDFAPEDVYTVEVMNAHTVLGDHTAYWKNRDEFLLRITSKLLEITGLRTRSDAAPYAALRRRWRVRWRVAARWTLAGIAAALAWRWFVEPPAFLGSLLHALPDSGFPISLLRGHPMRLILLLVGLLWACPGLIVLLLWRRWDASEIKAGISGADYVLADRQFLCFLAAFAAWVFLGVWAVAGVPGLAALVVLAICGAGVFTCKGPRDWLILRSASGAWAVLRRLRRTELEMELERAANLAFDKHKADELARAGSALRGLNDDLAICALSEATGLGSANAAWALGLYFDEVERRTNDAQEKARARQKAKDAFSKGADMGDANCAWWLAIKEKDDGHTAAATKAYRRAFDLGDVGSAHALGWALENQKQYAAAITVYEEGMRRGDALSAVFLANRWLNPVRWLHQTDTAEANRLRARALVLYRRAFDLGHIQAALDEGRLHREADDIARARRAYSAGARLRDAECAYELGVLEEEEQQDTIAARAAYALAVRLDADGEIAARAHYRLGCLLEREGKSQAAMHQFRAAMGLPGSEIGCAEAAVSLGRLLERPPEPEETKAKEAFQRGMTLNPRVAAQPYVEFLERTNDRDTAVKLYTNGVSEFPAEALLRLGRFLHFRYPTEAKDLFRLALQRRSAPASVELYKMLRQEGNDREAHAVLDEVLKLGRWFALKVSRLFEDAQHIMEATELKKRAEDIDETL
jgi:tetratricopeptide (TPR) repeat protein